MKWGQGRAEIEKLLADKHLQQVPPSREHADRLLAQARRHVVSAASTAGTDPEGAYALLYDAARKALWAILENQGLRPTSAGGHLAAHRAGRSVVNGTSTNRLHRAVCWPSWLGGRMAPSRGFADDALTAEYYDRRAPDFDDWYLPFPASAFDRVFTGHFYGHLPPDERAAFLAEARRVASTLVVVDAAARPGIVSEQWQERVLNDGSRRTVFKRYFSPGQLGDEIGGEELFAGDWLVVAQAA